MNELLFDTATAHYRRRADLQMLIRSRSIIPLTDPHRHVEV